MKTVKIETLRAGTRFNHGLSKEDGFPCVVVDKRISGPMIVCPYDFMVPYCHVPTGTVSYSYSGYDVWVEE